MGAKSEKGGKSKKKLMYKKKENKTKIVDDKIAELQEQYNNVSLVKKSNYHLSQVFKNVF